MDGADVSLVGLTDIMYKLQAQTHDDQIHVGQIHGQYSWIQPEKIHRSMAGNHRDSWIYAERICRFTAENHYDHWMHVDKICGSSAMRTTKIHGSTPMRSTAIPEITLSRFMDSLP